MGQAGTNVLAGAPRMEASSTSTVCAIPMRVAGAFDRGGDLHQAAGVGGDQQLRAGRDDVGGLAVAELAAPARG